MAKLNELVERQNRIWTRMQEIQSAAEGDEWTAEARTNWDKADGELREVSSDIERAQRAVELESVDYRQVVQTSPEERDVESPESAAEKRAAEYNRAFGAYMRGGLDNLTVDERGLMLQNAVETRAPQATSPGSAGGFLVPTGYRNIMAESMKAFGGLLQHANVITTSEGNPLQWPTNDDTGNKGKILAENTQLGSADVTFGQRTLGAYMYTSDLVLVSYQLLQDSAFDLDTWLPKKLGERIGRIVAEHLISGTGTGQPTGVATNATKGADAALAAISYENLVDLEHSIDPAYRASGNCRFLFNDATLAVLRKLKDTDGRPLWSPIPVAGMPATINGVPYSIDQGMPGVAASAKSVLFGDFREGYLVRQVVNTQMVRLAERYADFLQVGFFGYARLDAKPDNPGAVRALEHAAT